VDFTGAKDDGGSDNWSYSTRKDPVKLSPPAKQHPAFIQAGTTNSVRALMKY